MTSCYVAVPCIEKPGHVYADCAYNRKYQGLQQLIQASYKPIGALCVLLYECANAVFDQQTSQQCTAVGCQDRPCEQTATCKSCKVVVWVTCHSAGLSGAGARASAFQGSPPALQHLPSQGSPLAAEPAKQQDSCKCVVHICDYYSRSKC